MSEPAELKKRRGRPPKNPEGAKGGNLTFRVRDGMRERLEASAKARGLSISEDVEKRIERTFDFDYLLGDNPTALVFRSIAGAVRRFEQSSGKSWIEDSETQERVHEAVSQMVDALLGMRTQIDDRKSTGRGLPVDWNDLQQRLRARLIALEISMEELQAYHQAKVQEYLPVMRESRDRRSAKREINNVRLILRQSSRDDLANIAASLVLIEGEARVARTQAGIVVSEQSPDGVWRQVAPEWHGAEPPPWAEDTAEELRDRVEMMIGLPPVEVSPEARRAIEEALDLVRFDPPEGAAPVASPAPDRLKTPKRPLKV